MGRGKKRNLYKKAVFEKRKKKIGWSRDRDDDGENEIRWYIPKLGTIVVNA